MKPKIQWFHPQCGLFPAVSNSSSKCPRCYKMKHLRLSSDPLPDDSVGQLGLPEECRLHARLPGHQDQGWPGSGGRGALQGGPELLLLLIRTSDPFLPPPISSPHLNLPKPCDTQHPPPSLSKQTTSVMFDSLLTSRLSILFPSAMFIREPWAPTRGEENRGSGSRGRPRRR